MKEYKRACEEIQEMASLISDTAPLKRLSSPEKPSFVCSVSKEEFCGTVEKDKGVYSGRDIFQAVISRQFTSSYEGSLLNAYRVLRTTNPSPYMVYMNIDQDEIISTSRKHWSALKTASYYLSGSRFPAQEPGTRRTEGWRKKLLADEKRLSEHNMLVDLGRNDIGRIAEFGSVEVTGVQDDTQLFQNRAYLFPGGRDIKPGLDGCSASGGPASGRHPIGRAPR